MALSIAIVLLAAPADVPCGVGAWPEELGNHRARIRVAVSRASGEIIFRPNEPGEYFVY